MGKFGVLCLEGEWSYSLTVKQTVLPLLELLEQTAPDFKFIHRRIATVEEFDFFINKWKLKEYSDYKILYISTHGYKGGINIAGKTDISLEQLSQRLRSKAQGRFIYLAGCDTMKSPNTDLLRLLKETKAKGLIGYTKSVCSLESSAFDMLLLEALRYYDGKAAGYAKKYIEKNYGTLSKKLGFKFVH